MTKLKKVLAVALTLLVVCTFAVSAFAAESAADVKKKLEEAGLTSEQIAALAEKYTLADYEAGVAAWNSGNEASVKKAVADAEAALKSAGVPVSDVKLSITDGKATVSATVNGKSESATATVSTTSTSNAIVNSSSSVIKATGDNSAVVLATGALAIVAVLGLAVRKNSVVA